MKHIIFHDNPDNQYAIGILIKDSSFTHPKMDIHYVSPLIKRGIKPDSILGLSLKYNDQGKAPAKLIKEHLDTVLRASKQLGMMTLLVADTAYFKTLTGQRKAEPHYGYILPCAIKGYEYIDVILTINYQRLFYDPTLQDRLDMSLDTVVNHVNGTHVDLGQNIIKHADYPKDWDEIRNYMDSLLDKPILTCDIETFSLDISTAGIGTMAFAWSQHEGCAFAVDYNPDIGTSLLHGYGEQLDRDDIKDILYDFFIEYKGKLIFHNGTFDIKMIIYNVYMKHDQDIEGLIHGLKVMYRHVEDTKLITYLATNSTSGNNLSLKHNAFEFTGNYAQDDINDIRLIPYTQLLEYNLIDCLATWYVYNKNHPIMIQDEQEEIYNTIMIPSMRVITHMELIGMPMDNEAVQDLDYTLATLISRQRDLLRSSPYVKKYQWHEQRMRMIEANLLLKKKVKPIEDFYEEFNPASNKQLQGLLYKQLGFEVIDKTDTGLPATGGKTLKKLLVKHMNDNNLTEEDL